MKKTLTPKEGKVFQLIKAFQQEEGHYPTYREIQAALKLSSINSISQYVKQLAKKGFLQLTKNKGYRLPAEERQSLVSLPLLGTIQAGSTNTTQETTETMTLPSNLVSSPKRSFLLRIRGNSMSDVGIHEDDIVIVNSSKEESIGDIVVALIEGETTVKRLEKKGNQLYLKAESTEHKNIYPKGHWEVQGVVTGLWRQY